MGREQGALSRKTEPPNPNIENKFGFDLGDLESRHAPPPEGARTKKAVRRILPSLTAESPAAKRTQKKPSALPKKLAPAPEEEELTQADLDRLLVEETDSAPAGGSAKPVARKAAETHVPEGKTGKKASEAAREEEQKAADEAWRREALQLIQEGMDHLDAQEQKPPKPENRAEPGEVVLDVSDLADAPMEETDVSISDIEDAPEEEEILELKPSDIKKRPDTGKTAAAPAPERRRRAKSPETWPSALHEQDRLERNRVRAAEQTYENAKAEYERLLTELEGLKKGLKNAKLPDAAKAALLERQRQMRGLDEKLDAAVDRLNAAQQAYEKERAVWEKKGQASEALAGLKRAREAGMQKRVVVEGEEGRRKTWFEQGEDPAYLEQLAEGRENEDAREVEDIRRYLSEDYQEDAEQVSSDRRTRRAQGLIQQGALPWKTDDLDRYGYLVKEQARIDRELETAGWWTARKLRRDLRQIRSGGYQGTGDGLDAYERQVRQAAQGRTLPKGSGTSIFTNAEAPPASKGKLAPGGSGTSIYEKKQGMLARWLPRWFGKK